MMSERQLLIIGGTTGMGAEFAKSASAFYPTRVIHVPPPGSLNVQNDAGIDFYFNNLRQGWGLNPPPLDVAYFAGYNRIMALGKMNRVSLDHTFAVNASGFIKVIDSMCRHGWDDASVNVVAIASDAARIPMRQSIAYCSSKAALVMAVRCAARELAPLWRVNAVSPGVVADTPMSEVVDREVQAARGWTQEQAREYESAMIPMGRRALKAEVADLALSTLKGPQYLTGANIEINGGK